MTVHAPDLRDPPTPAAALIAVLNLRPHPEGGHYRETWRDAPADGARGVGTAILFLLAAGERSRWHHVDAAEGWHWHAGASPALRRPSQAWRLGPDLSRGETPFAMIPAGTWQAANSLGAWTLVGCTGCPAFRFEGSELALPGWKP